MKWIVIIFGSIISILLIAFIIFSNQIESLLSYYPNSLRALTTIFTFLTTAISIGIAYKSYSSNIKLLKEDKEQQSYKVKKLLKIKTNNSIKILGAFCEQYKYMKRKETDFSTQDLLNQFKIIDVLVDIENKIQDIEDTKLEILTNNAYEDLESRLNLLTTTKAIINMYEISINNKYPEKEREEIERDIIIFVEDVIKLI